MAGEQIKNLLAAIEAILFVYGEPITVKKIADLLKIKEEEVKTSLNELEKIFESQERGLKLIFKDSPAGGSVQLATKPDFTSFLENFIKEEFKENLTPASLETLSLIAYLGPVSRAQIDYYRGVNSTFILRSLLIRGLVERYPAPKRANIYPQNNYPRYGVGVYLYEVSFDLLKYLGISKVEELPEYEKFKGLSQNF
jgi:segregation and condensation protein B